ncbi:MAG TPA: hypothetical protein VJ772_05025 [Nitrososphaeraceae archaeon]|nr:hypothetical protein [Nitrososphaeraceae archaeon]
MYLSTLILYVNFVLLIITTMILGIAITHYAYSETSTIYCYAEDQEGYICFDTLKKCKNEQKDDETADSRCYKDIE